MAHVPQIKAAAKPRAHEWTLDVLAICAVCLGAAAVALALFVCYGVGEPVAAAFILAATATIIGLFLHETAQLPKLS